MASAMKRPCSGGMFAFPSRWMTSVGAEMVGSTERMSYVRLMRKMVTSWFWLVDANSTCPGGASS